MRKFTLIAILICIFPAQVIANDKATVALSGDVRFGVFGRDRNDRYGQRSQRDEALIRARAGVLVNFTDALSGKLRLAGRYSSDDRFNTYHFKVFESIPSDGGLRLGDSTIDEFYFRYKPSEILTTRVGRFQTSFELEGVAKKSLSRHGSDGTSITWTDGVHVKYTY